MGETTSDIIDISEAELEEIELIESFITKEEAIQKVMKYLEDSSYRLTSSGLQKRDQKYVWSFDWSKEQDKLNGYQYATVDAKTGEIISFDHYEYSEDYEEQEPKYDLQECKKIAEKFIAEIQPEKSKIVVEDVHAEYEEGSKEYYFTYYRTYNNIRTPFNYINVSIDATTGNINSYYLNWFDFTDLSAVYSSNPKSVDEAYEILFNEIGLDLGYFKINKDEKAEIILGYALNSTICEYIDAHTGDLLTINLKKIEENTETISFKDIDKHWAKDDINALAEMGVIERTEYFNPNNKATQIEIIKMIVNGIYSSWGDSRTDDEYYRIAIQNGVITAEEKNPTKEITRIEVAKIVLKVLGVESVAELSSKVFVNEFNDIDDTNLGFASIVNGFEIMKGYDKQFNPNDSITKAEIATVVLRTMQKR